MATGYVGIGPTKINTVGFMQVDRVHVLRVPQFRHIKNMDPFLVAHKRVPELDSDALGMVQYFMPDHRRKRWMCGIAQVDHSQARIAANVGVMACNRDCGGPTQDSIRIECDVAFQEIVGRVAIEQRGSADHHESLVFVGHVDVGVKWMNWCFKVFGSMRSSWVGRDRCRGSDRGCELGSDVEPLS